jgi:hypothetical protein
MRILIKVVDPACIKQGSPPFDAMNLIAFLEKKFPQIGPILSRYTCNQRLFHFIPLYFLP